MSSVVNKLKRPPVNYEDAVNPESWRTIGRRLMVSAEFLWVPLKTAIEGFAATRSARSREQRAEYEALADHYAGFFVLAGFAVENYLKARLLANRIAAVGPFSNGREAIEYVLDRQTPRKYRRRPHEFVALAKAADALTSQNELLLARLSDYVLWAGRYPVPLADSALPFERTTRDRDLRDIKALIADLER